jgi:hypothetical protein
MRPGITRSFGQLLFLMLLLVAADARATGEATAASNTKGQATIPASSAATPAAATRADATTAAVVEPSGSPAPSAVNLTAYPKEVQRKCKQQSGQPTRMSIRPTLLFGQAVEGVLVECHHRSKRPGMPDTERPLGWFFALRRDPPGWSIVHQASERYEEVTQVQTATVAGRELLLEAHSSAGRSIDARVAVLGGDREAPRLELLYRATTDADYTDYHGVCAAREEAGKLVLTYAATPAGKLRPAPRNKLQVRAVRVEECRK